MDLLKWLLKVFKTSGSHKQRKWGRKVTVERNARRMRRRYPLNRHGLFGEAGKGRVTGKGVRKEHKRVIKSANQNRTARDFYSKIGRGGKESALPNGHGKRTDLPDKTTIIYREKTSTPNSPAVSLNTRTDSKIKNQKIHFEKEEKE